MTSFQHFWSLGYRRLVPIVPPGAPLSATSSLARRPNDRGKAVGVKGRDGTWHGFNWLPHEATEHDIERWTAMGAGVGIKTGQGLIAIDADTLDLEHARTIAKAVVKHFGDLPARVGRYPKVLYPLRVSEPMRYTRIEFGQPDERGVPSRVEILSDGRQFVAAGIHSTTGKPYAWPLPLVPFDSLPIVPAAAVQAFLDDLRSQLPNATAPVSEGSASDRAKVNQEALKGDLELVRRAVSVMPNTNEHFPTRDDYVRVGYAIKAALQDHPDEAFALWADWCDRWRDDNNDPGIVQADWDRMRKPFGIGAHWLYELAEKTAPGKFSAAEEFFQPITDEPPNPFAKIDLNPFDPQADKIDWIDPATWQGATPPARRWLVAGVVPDGEVSLLTGEGGVGKTLLAQQLATCVAAGLPFFGRETVQARVMLFLCEDSADELHLRQRDINAAHCLDMCDVSSHLRIASRKYMDNLLSLWDRNTGAMKRSAVWSQLRDDAVAWGAKLVVIDTIADTFGGSEIDRSQVRQFVQSCLGRLAQEIGGAVLALGHPSRAGQAVGGDGTSGSTAWHASVRSRLYLEHAAKDKSGPFRKLTNKKANYGPAGDQWMLRWARGAFELVTAKSSAGEESAGATPSMAAAIDDAILAAVAELAAAGVPLSDARNSSYWAPRVFQARFPATLGLYSSGDVEEGWLRALRAGRVREAIVARRANRHPIIGYTLAPMPGGVFG